ncbi:DUF1801 domain-containing protein [Pseudorhodobacter sp.]|uniref:DUF1801 domain-containing protein n=1 Tax=Pseudorhodobacter sp. TaxID=1934400 RepID=UPI002649F8C5|nr:DUF1801 domain-containing protein [Pseudorhodobacter sp.]MDN5788261.1 DUF1801 domain-containing protein [Pseudorhodobacter sp.]
MSGEIEINADTLTSPAIPARVADVIAGYPASIGTQLLRLREMVFAVAARTEGVGPLTETLKWGEPAYLTETSKSGTTIRLGMPKSAPGNCAIFLNCKTTLIETFRSQFPDDFQFEGNRALLLSATAPLPEIPLQFCLHAALTYHRTRKRGA